MHKITSVLLVDDDMINNFINQQLIEELSVTKELNIANNGLEAIKFLEQFCDDDKGCPELILLDINMPVMDGFEFLEEFDNLTLPLKEKIKVVMLTTSTNPHDVEKLNGFSIAGFMNKPLTEEKILALVDKIFPPEQG